MSESSPTDGSSPTDRPTAYTPPVAGELMIARGAGGAHCVTRPTWPFSDSEIAVVVPGSATNTSSVIGSTVRPAIV